MKYLKRDVHYAEYSEMRRVNMCVGLAGHSAGEVLCELPAPAGLLALAPPPTAEPPCCPCQTAPIPKT